MYLGVSSKSEMYSNAVNIPALYLRSYEYFILIFKLKRKLINESILSSLRNHKVTLFIDDN